jgi:quercetin dioxygenase-like cupin family protein
MIIRTILKKTTGSIRSILFEVGDVLTEKIIPFDTLIQIVNGKAEVVINGIPNVLKAGQSIIIPAHAINTITAIVQFRMISTIIKSGYEEVS